MLVVVAAGLLQERVVRLVLVAVRLVGHKQRDQLLQ
jgi:hypothetical protein